MIRRRAAIEPVIGNLKTDSRMGQNFLNERGSKGKCHVGSHWMEFKENDGEVKIRTYPDILFFKNKEVFFKFSS